MRQRRLKLWESKGSAHRRCRNRDLAMKRIDCRWSARETVAQGHSIDRMHLF